MRHKIKIRAGRCDGGPLSIVLDLGSPGTLPSQGFRNWNRAYHGVYIHLYTRLQGTCGPLLGERDRSPYRVLKQGVWVAIVDELNARGVI